MKYRNYRGLALVCVALAVTIFGVSLWQPVPKYTSFTPPRALSEQTFYTTQGEMTTADLRGKVSLVYIGYTNCPDYCPTTLGDLKQMMKALGSKADEVNVLFITVDPARDTLEKLESYIAVFDNRFIGAQMSADALPLFTRELGLSYALGEPGETGYYPVEHSTNLMLLDRQANLIGFWRYGTPAGDLASDVKAVLRR